MRLYNVKVKYEVLSFNLIKTCNYHLFSIVVGKFTIHIVMLSSFFACNRDYMRIMNSTVLIV